MTGANKSYEIGLFDEAGEIHRAAVFSSCRLYRYTLERYWNTDLPRLLFVLLNPSTADAVHDDPTNRKGMGFARRWGFGSCVFVNLFAFRSPHPKVMKAAAKPVGPANDVHIVHQATAADRIVLAWGNDGAHRGRDREVLELLGSLGKELWHLGLTKPGQPRHPLYPPYTTELQRWGGSQ